MSITLLYLRNILEVSYVIYFILAISQESTFQWLETIFVKKSLFAVVASWRVLLFLVETLDFGREFCRIIACQCWRTVHKDFSLMTVLGPVEFSHTSNCCCVWSIWLVLEARWDSHAAAIYSWWGHNLQLRSNEVCGSSTQHFWCLLLFNLPCCTGSLINFLVTRDNWPWRKNSTVMEGLKQYHSSPPLLPCSSLRSHLSCMFGNKWRVGKLLYVLFCHLVPWDASEFDRSIFT